MIRALDPDPPRQSGPPRHGLGVHAVARDSHPLVVMAARLARKRIAVLATDGVEQTELEAPIRALIAERARVEIIAPDGKDTIQAWDATDWGDTFEVDRALSEAVPADYDGLVVPGGVQGPDRLRGNPDAVALVRGFVDEGLPVSAICHGPWLLVEAGRAAGRRLTSYPSIRTDLTNAGATWVDEPVVVDENLVTSRSPEDMESFLRATVASMQDRPPG